MNPFANIPFKDAAVIEADGITERMGSQKIVILYLEYFTDSSSSWH